MKYSVKIIIPFYKETLKDWEKAALANNMEKLSNYPVVFLKPEGLNISSYEQACPQAETISVSTDWLGTKRGIAGYNEMMMSEAFYQLFSDCEYILICHTDAWIFRDDLSACWWALPSVRPLPSCRWSSRRSRSCPVWWRPASGRWTPV